jgi:tetratricopeptide (TPR) repeat protein
MTNEQAWWLLSRALFDLDRLEESREAVKKALALVPEGGQSSQLESFLAALELRLSLTKEQRAALDESDRLNGEAVDLLRDGDVDGAVEVLQRAVEAYERNEGALSNLTRCLVEMRELDDAERYAQKRADLFPDSTGGWVNLGYVYELKGACRVVSCRVVSCRVVSCRVVSCRVVSCGN